MSVNKPNNSLNAENFIERRQEERFPLVLDGRFMSTDRKEYPCSTIDISSIGVAVSGTNFLEVGQRVVAYFETLGRIEGKVVRSWPSSFSMVIQASISKRRRLAAHISWLAQQQAILKPEKRRYERYIPDEPNVSIKLADSRSYVAAIIDVSAWGAALRIDVENAPPVGETILVGRTSAYVKRHFPGGIAVEFCKPSAA